MLGRGKWIRHVFRIANFSRLQWFIYFGHLCWADLVTLAKQPKRKITKQRQTSLCWNVIGGSYRQLPILYFSVVFLGWLCSASRRSWTTELRHLILSVLLIVTWTSTPGDAEFIDTVRSSAQICSNTGRSRRPLEEQSDHMHFTSATGGCALEQKCMINRNEFPFNWPIRPGRVCSLGHVEGRNSLPKCSSSLDL